MALFFIFVNRVFYGGLIKILLQICFFFQKKLKIQSNRGKEMMNRQIKPVLTMYYRKFSISKKKSEITNKKRHIILDFFFISFLFDSVVNNGLGVGNN